MSQSSQYQDNDHAASDAVTEAPAATQKYNSRKPLIVRVYDIFGERTVVELMPERRYPNGKKHRPAVVLRCKCGREEIVERRELNHPHRQRCMGCAKGFAPLAPGDPALQPPRKYSDAASGASERSGKNRSKEHRIWAGILDRCYASKAKRYADYGGRGITVCNRWRGFSGFDNFLADMKRCPDGKTLDRKDNDGPYSPENCRWATWVEQNNNKRNTIWVTARGRRMSASDWGREIAGDGYREAAARITANIRAGHTHEAAIDMARPDFVKSMTARREAEKLARMATHWHVVSLEPGSSWTCARGDERRGCTHAKRDTALRHASKLNQKTSTKELVERIRELEREVGRLRAGGG